MSVVRPIPKLTQNQSPYIDHVRKFPIAHLHRDQTLYQHHELPSSALAAAALAVSNKIQAELPITRESAFRPIPQKKPSSSIPTLYLSDCQTCIPKATHISELHRIPHYLDRLLIHSYEPFFASPYSKNGFLTTMDQTRSCFTYGLAEQCFSAFNPHFGQFEKSNLKDNLCKLNLTNSNSTIFSQPPHQLPPFEKNKSSSSLSAAAAAIHSTPYTHWQDSSILSFFNLPTNPILEVNTSSTSIATPSPSKSLSTSIGKDYRQPMNHPPRYQCEACKKSYATFGGLSKHKQFHCVSQVKREFSCKFCCKSYASLGALKMHIRTHTLPCRCKLCGKAFSRPWLLQGHIRTHTGEKPFKCPHCGRAFADRSNLRAHLQTHSDVKKYGCKSCNKTFSRMSLLLKHEDSSCPGLRS
ncbi:zinc finger protein 391-like [Octopus sinensis]|uniref:Zinc finger protein SNAI2 n=1 Tax=Octopus sinensis TaxID=2607531 RepID=A0A6P7SUV6_9MOLL|nr:zinc finger protein 391-like [Octopus sinensis]